MEPRRRAIPQAEIGRCGKHHFIELGPERLSRCRDSAGKLREARCLELCNLAKP